MDWWDNSEQYLKILIFYLGKGGGGALGIVVKGATHQNLTIFSVIFSLKNSPTCRKDL